MPRDSLQLPVSALFQRFPALSEALFHHLGLACLAVFDLLHHCVSLLLGDQREAAF